MAGGNFINGIKELGMRGWGESLTIRIDDEGVGAEMSERVRLLVIESRA